MSAAAHAKLSPSAAERWFTCSGSVTLSDGMPQSESEFAAEGTRAHACAEEILFGRECKPDSDEMLEHVHVYTDHVNELHIADPDAAISIEARVTVTKDVYGTADAIVWHPSSRTLYVRDLKYGAGVPVEVSGNLQLKIYALAALLTMKYPAAKVDVGIVQPRCPHPDGFIRSIVFDVVDLVDFYADLLKAVDRVRLEPTLYTPSEKGCRWCLAAPKCPALKNKAQELAKQVFAPGVAYDAKALAETLDYLPILEGWIKNTREFAYAEAEKGHAIPMYKLVEKRATRKWKPGVLITEELAAKAGLTIEQMLKEPELQSPATIEKLLPKEQRAILDDLCVKESSGHMLVHQSDKRPAIQLDAKSAFANS